MDLYAEIILDYYKNPRNYGVVERAELDGSDSNPMCGDKLRITAHEQDGVIVEIKFEGEGCAISIAAVSLITEEVKGKKLSEVLEMGKDDVFRLLGTEISPGRIKCAMLGLSCLKKLIKLYGKK